MKKLVKIVPIILVAIMVLSVFSTTMAVGVNPRGQYEGTTVGSFNNIGNKIIGALQAIGSIAAVAILVDLGIRYMMGSTEEKAEYKKTMIPYVIGAVFIFAAPWLAGIIYKLAGSLGN